MERPSGAPSAIERIFNCLQVQSKVLGDCEGPDYRLHLHLCRSLHLDCGRLHLCRSLRLRLRLGLGSPSPHTASRKNASNSLEVSPQTKLSQHSRCPAMELSSKFPRAKCHITPTWPRSLPKGWKFPLPAWAKPRQTPLGHLSFRRSASRREVTACSRSGLDTVVRCAHSGRRCGASAFL